MNWIDKYLTKTERNTKAAIAISAAMNFKMPETLEQEIEAFGVVGATGETALLLQGKMLCSMLNKDPNVFEKLISRYPHMTVGYLLALERVGLGKLDPRVMLLGDQPIAHRIATLEPKEQARIFDTPLPVVRKVNGDIKVEHKRLGEMSQNERLLAIGPSGLRAKDEQAKIVEEKSKPSPRFWFEAHCVYFTSRGPYTLSEIATICERLKKLDVLTLESSMRKAQIV